MVLSHLDKTFKRILLAICELNDPANWQRMRVKSSSGGKAGIVLREDRGRPIRTYPLSSSAIPVAGAVVVDI